MVLIQHVLLARNSTKPKVATTKVATPRVATKKAVAPKKGIDEALDGLE